MPDAIREGQYVTLKGQDDTRLEGVYEVLGIPMDDGKPSKHALRVKTPHGTIIRIHKSRVDSIANQPGKEEEMPEETAEATEATKQEQTPEIQAEPEAKTSPKKAKKKTKKAKAKPEAKPEPEPFDLKQFAVENGGVLFSKRCNFDHKKYKVHSHCVIDTSKKVFYCFNTYTKSNGVVTLGSKAKPMAYPLKGKKMNKVKICKKTGEKETISSRGTKTAEEIMISYKKKGYKEADLAVTA